MKVGSQEISISNRDKVLFPESGITKGDLVDYYNRVSECMLVHLEGRPISMHRFPDGIGEEDFYQKQKPDYFPEWIEDVEVSKKGDGTSVQVVCDHRASLVYLANQACITIHTWLSRKGDLNHPDRIVFDLDPPGSDEGFDEVIFGALKLKEVLAESGLEPFVMTTGSKGLHVTVPIERTVDFEGSLSFSKMVAEHLASRHDDRLTVEQRKAKRGDRVYIDTYRNSYAQTTVTPYSVRAIEGAPVATPLEWKELDRDIGPRKYHIKNILRRLGHKNDPWNGIDGRSARVDPSSLEP
jgi:bifunctional non-homologous end joining protein LigD